jgi:hypothetical protein
MGKSGAATEGRPYNSCPFVAAPVYGYGHKLTAFPLL